MQKYILLYSVILIKALSGSVDEYIPRIQTFIDDGKYLQANEVFELAIKEYDANAALYFIGGTVAVKLDRLDDANKYHIKAIELDNNNDKYRLAQGKLSVLKNAMNDAKELEDAVIKSVSGMIEG